MASYLAAVTLEKETEEPQITFIVK